MVQIFEALRKNLSRRAPAAILLLPLLAAFGGCTASEREPATVRAVPGLIWDVVGDRGMKQDELARRLSRAEVVLIGEVHDNPRHHAIEADLIFALAVTRRHDTVALEMIDREQQAEVEQLWREQAGAEAILAATGFDARGWGAERYRPVVEAMLEAEVSPLAANLSRAEAAQVMREGWAAVFDPAMQEVLAIEAAWSEAAAQRLAAALRESHCNALPEEMLPGMLAAQRARDAVMADRVLARRVGGVILVTGAQHARRDHGVPAYLAARAPGIEVATLRLVEVDGDRPVADYLDAGAAFDFVWFTTRAKRADPCEVFRQQKAGDSDAD